MPLGASAHVSKETALRALTQTCNIQFFQGEYPREGGWRGGSEGQIAKAVSVGGAEHQAQLLFAFHRENSLALHSLQTLSCGITHLILATSLGSRYSFILVTDWGWRERYVKDALLGGPH